MSPPIDEQSGMLCIIHSATTLLSLEYAVAALHEFSYVGNVKNSKMCFVFLLNAYDALTVGIRLGNWRNPLRLR